MEHLSLSLSLLLSSLYGSSGVEFVHSAVCVIIHLFSFFFLIYVGIKVTRI